MHIVIAILILAGLLLLTTWLRHRKTTLPANSQKLSPRQLINAAWREVEKGNAPKAITYAKRAIRLNPKDSYLYLTLGLIYTQQNRYIDAIPVYMQGLQNCPDDIGLFHGLAKAQEALGDKQGALDAYQKVADIDVTDEQALYYTVRGTARQRTGNIEGARTDLERAKELYLKEQNMELYRSTVEQINQLDA